MQKKKNTLICRYRPRFSQHWGTLSVTAWSGNSSGKGGQLKVWSLLDCRGKTAKTKETREMNSMKEQEAFVRQGSCRAPWAGSYITSTAVRCLYKDTSCSSANSVCETPASPRWKLKWLHQFCIKSLADQADQGFLQKHMERSTPHQQRSPQHARLFV